MFKIIYHWSGGSYKVSDFDRQFYHFLIDDKGKIFKGKYDVEDNLNCNDKKYAAHTGGGNTNSIGIAFLGMYNFNEKTFYTKYPLTKIQCESGFKLGAELSKKYTIDLNRKLSVQTHYGFGSRNPNTTSKGKIDIVYLPPFPNIPKNCIEEFIRNKVIWYRSKIN